MQCAHYSQKALSRYFLHIGMPRTATTFLQRQFFPKLEGVEYIGLPYTQINPAFQRLMFADESVYNPHDLQGELQQIGGDKVLFSNENFVGQSLYWHFGNRTRIAQRLHAAMPQATIILFLRNQPDLLRSAYEIALQDAETKTLSEFVLGQLPQYDLHTYRQKPAVDLFDYAEFNTYHSGERAAGYDFSPLIDLYKQLFPRVEIILFEEFKTNPAAVLQRLTSILEVEISDNLINEMTQTGPINQGVTASQATRLRRLNRWREVLHATAAGRAFYVRAKRRILKQNGGSKLSWTTTEQAYFNELFQPINAQLHARYPEIGLSRYSEAYCLKK